jgi:hypothetical protein
MNSHNQDGVKKMSQFRIVLNNLFKGVLWFYLAAGIILALIMLYSGVMQ